MATSSKINRMRQTAAAGAMTAILAIGMAGAASAQTTPDQHSGGVSPGSQAQDSGAQVLGVTVSRQQSRGSLPFTGSDAVGLTAVGLAAVAAGSTAVVGSRRRAARATA